MKKVLFIILGCVLALAAVIIPVAILDTKVSDLRQGNLSSEQSADDTLNLPEGSTFEIHFIDVGQADAALVLCDGKAMLIDGGNIDDSALIYTYLKNREIDTLEYVVATHAHEDHIGGLAGALNYATAKKIYCPVTDYESEAFDNFKKYVSEQGKTITVPKPNDKFSLGSATIRILAVNTEGIENDSTIVLKIMYGNTSFLFTGDAEYLTEKTITEGGYNLKSTVLKVGHHGSDSSTSYEFLREVMPQYAVISVGKENTYGHPTEIVLSRLKDAGAEIFRTDKDGTIICTSDGRKVTFKTIKDADYILNTKSLKFHKPGCDALKDMSDSNKGTFYGSREDLIADGYIPCGWCKP